MKPLHTNLTGWGLLLILAGALLSGCIHYEPKPLDAAAGLETLSKRSLSDPGLQEFIVANTEAAVSWPPASWDFQALTLAALYFNPDLAVTRAELAEAEAARITAGERPNPAIGLTPGYNTSTPAGEGISPWVLDLSFDLPLETAGKREKRVSEADHLSEASRMALAERVWEIRAGVRQALVALWSAGERMGRSERKLAAATALARISEAQFEAGDIDRTDLMGVRLLEQQAYLESVTAAGDTDRARIDLAVSAGLPSHGLDGVEIDFAGVNTVPGEIPEADARRSALLNRADILGALESYAASESALRLAVAEQYPDISLGPGYEYDQGDNKWMIGFQWTLPLLSRNRGPIAEAEARRTLAAAEFTALQSTVLGDIETAVAAVQAHRRQLAAADEILEQARQQTNVVDTQYRAGAISKQLTLSSRLEEISAEAIRLDSLTALQTSLGELEYALQTPLDATVLPAVISSEEK